MVSYKKTNWKNGDIITESGMNNIENGIYNATTQINTNTTNIESKQDKLTAGNNITIDGTTISASVDLSNYATTEDLTLVSDAVLSVGARVDTAETDITNIKSQVSTNTSDIAALKETSSNTLVAGTNISLNSDSEAKTTTINCTVDTSAIETNITTLQTEVGDINTDISDLTTRVATNESNITNLTTTVESKADLSNVYTQSQVDEKLNLKADQTSLDTTNTNLTSLQSTVESNTTNIASNTDSISTLNTTISGMYTNSQIDNLLEKKQNVLTAGDNITIDTPNIEFNNSTDEGALTKFSVDALPYGTTIIDFTAKKISGYGLSGFNPVQSSIMSGTGLTSSGWTLVLDDSNFYVSGSYNYHIVASVLKTKSSGTVTSFTITNNDTSEVTTGTYTNSSGGTGNFVTQQARSYSFSFLTINSITPQVQEISATNTTYNAATTSSLGLVQPDGTTITIDDNGVISSSGGTEYTLPTATTDTLGGVKIGDGLSITDDGVLSASGGSSITVDSELSITSENPVQNKVITDYVTELDAKIDTKANTSSLSTVATSGSYNDLSDKPTIPTAVTVDTELSTTSTNPVANSVITSNINEIDTAVQTNAADIATIENRLTTDESATLTNSNKISTLETDLSTANTNISTNTTNISDLTTRVTSAEGEIDSLQTATLTNASAISTLQSTATTQGNTFNGASQLVQLDSDGKLPAIDGSQLTNVTADVDLSNYVQKSVEAGTNQNVNGTLTAYNLSVISTLSASDIDTGSAGFFVDEDNHTILEVTTTVVDTYSNLIRIGGNHQSSAYSRVSMAASGAVYQALNVTSSLFGVGNTNLPTQIYGSTVMIGNSSTTACNVTIGSTVSSVPIAQVSLPSSRYVDVTLPSSGSTFTAPADGYLTLRASISSAGNSYWDSYVTSSDGALVISSQTYIASFVGDTLSISVPMKKGDIYNFNYTMTFSNVIFCRFLYCGGTPTPSS